MKTSATGVLAGFVAVVAAVGALVSCPSSAAERYPSGPIRIIVPFSAGGPNDVIARIIAQKLADAWGTNVIVDNRPGAGGNIGTELVAKAAPDGHTLGLVSTAFVVNPSLYASAGYDPLKDFAPVILAAVSPVIIVAHPSLPARSVSELAQLARKIPLVYASPGAGTTGHLGGELFSTIAGINMQHVPYKGAAPAVTDLLGGQVKLGFIAVPPAAPHVKVGRLRAIAVTTGRRTASLPDVPTVAESGYPNYEVDNMYGVIAAAGTPRPVIERLNREVARIVNTPEVKGRLEGLGFDPVGSGIEAFAQYLRAESVKWAKVVKQSGARVE